MTDKTKNKTKNNCYVLMLRQIALNLAACCMQQQLGKERVTLHPVSTDKALNHHVIKDFPTTNKFDSKLHA